MSLAERIGAPVWNTVLPAAVNFPMSHPHYRGELPGDVAAIRRALEPADVVLLVAGDFFSEVFYAPGPPFPDGATVIQLDAAEAALGRHHGVHCPVAGEPRATLEAIEAAVADEADAAWREAVEARHVALHHQKEREAEAQEQRVKRSWDRRPMSPARLMFEIGTALPPDTVVVSEAISASPHLLRTLAPARPGDFYASRGGGIGQGLPGALGIRLAHPDRPCLCISGDGSSLYSIQALWSAAHHRLPVVFVILDNRTYRVLKINMDRYRGDFGVDMERGYPHLDLDQPAVDYVAVAEGLGVPGRHVAEPEGVGPALREAFAHGGPYLLDVAVEGRWPPR